MRNDIAKGNEERSLRPSGKGNMYDNKSRQSYMAQPNVKEFNKTFIPKALTGRPFKWNSVEELGSELKEYFELCDKTSTVPTITAIATWLHCHRDTIYAHANNSNSPFSDILQNVISICHTSLENGAIDGKVNSVVYIFMGKNYFSLTDTKNITVTPSSDQATISSSETMEALQKQIEEESIPNATFVES